MQHWISSNLNEKTAVLFISLHRLIHRVWNFLALIFDLNYSIKGIYHQFSIVLPQMVGIWMRHIKSKKIKIEAPEWYPHQNGWILPMMHVTFFIQYFPAVECLFLWKLPKESQSILYNRPVVALLMTNKLILICKFSGAPL